MSEYTMIQEMHKQEQEEQERQKFIIKMKAIL